MKILIKNGFVVSMVSDIVQTDVLIEEDRIKAIGPCEDSDVDKVIDATNKIVMPGLINAHTHMAMSIFRGYSDDEFTLYDWLRKRNWPIEDKMQREDVYHASMLSCLEMIKSGTTTFNDMYFFEDATAEAAEKMGMRGIVCACIIGDGEGATRRIHTSEELYQNWHNQGNGRIKVCVGIHAPNTCPPDTIKRGVELADRLGTPIHIHYLETKDEVKTIADQYKTTVTEYLKKCGLFQYHVMLAHGVQVGENDIPVLKGISGGIIHNPVSNMKLGSGFANIKKMRETGVTVALGTDGQGSTNTLDMFEEMKLAAYLQKGIYNNATVIAAEDIVKMATIEGAKVLGMDSELGSIEVGKKADIITIDINKPHLTPWHNLYSLLAYSVNGADVDTTIIDGKVLMENRVIQNANEQEIMDYANFVKKRLF